MIAGFEKPDSGQILLDGHDVAMDAPHVRPVNTVFQSYALFPLMTVWENVAFGLSYQNVSKEETRRRVGQALELAQMQDYAKRRPAQLSGGQQQRVALARALVLNPKVLLLDEPLGALDAQLRKHLQLQLRALQKDLGITFVYVTHDQEEALTMSDRIAVIAGGKVEQVGAPEEIYASPATTYVASFLGSANIFDADVSDHSAGLATCSALGRTMHAVCRDATLRGAAAIVIRPERITVAAPEAPVPSGHNSVEGTVTDVVYLGAASQVRVEVAPGSTLVAQVANHDGPRSVTAQPGSRVACIFDPDAVQVLRQSSAATAPELDIQLA